MSDKITVKEMKHDGLVDAAVTTASFMRNYRTVVLSLAGVVIIAVIVVAAYISHSSSLIENAEQSLSQARSKDDLRAVCEEYPDTPSAPLALIQLAAIQYDEKEFGPAGESYQLFLQQYPRHRLADFAQMGIAYSLEGKGEWAAAIEKYGAVGDLYPGSSLSAEADLNAGRCRVRLGRIQPAINSYREVIERFPRSMYAALAREELVQLLYRSQNGG